MIRLTKLPLIFALVLLAFVSATRLVAQGIPAMPAGFSVAGYLARNADLQALYSNDSAGAWQHYYLYGVKEGRRFDGEFQALEYLDLYGDLKTVFGTNYAGALLHWFNYGRKEGRMGGVPAGFDAEGYLTRAPDVRAALGSSRVAAWLHYLNYGLKEGRNDGDFIAVDYLAMYGDLRAVFGNDLMAAALHWYLYGRNEGRRIPAGFSVIGYFARNPDVQTVAGNDLYGAWQHYLKYGINEGRIFDEEFRVDEYLARYGDLRAVFGTNRSAAFLHWIYYGRPEGRLGRATPNTTGAPTSAATDAEASRFLIQATFGPDVASVAQIRSMQFANWIDQQIAMTPTYHLPYFNNRVAEYLARTGDNEGYARPRQEAWWQRTLTAPDQLRQRMAFALSEIFVISQADNLGDDFRGATIYYDMLLKNAFGNYRQLLDDVTFNPMMGSYLSMIRNRKPNTTTGSQPDENYAREIMQLFSIGLSELNLDGSLKLDANGKSIPTYTQPQIVGLAHVFTGWGPFFDPANPPVWEYSGEIALADDWFNYGSDMTRPMSYSQKYADLKTRTIVGGVTVPSTLTGPQRMKLALDTLANHPNVGPFIGKQLIQRFVTSNPSPAYISRVATAFNNNGVGVRGDLGATIRAVLLDPEARRLETMVDPKFGKLTEPLLRLTRLFRAFPPGPAPHADVGDNRLFIMLLWEMQEQSPLYAPTVFNFFKPGFAQPGPIASAGLVSPEFQIHTDIFCIGSSNRSIGIIDWGIGVDEPSKGNDYSYLELDYTQLLQILGSAGSGRPSTTLQGNMVDYLNQRFMGGTLSPFLRQTIMESLAAIPYFNDVPRYKSDVIRTAVYLVSFSPEFNITR